MHRSHPLIRNACIIGGVDAGDSTDQVKRIKLTAGTLLRAEWASLVNLLLGRITGLFTIDAKWIGLLAATAVPGQATAALTMVTLKTFIGSLAFLRLRGGAMRLL